MPLPIAAGVPATWQALPEIARVQRRSVRLIVAAQILGSFGVGASASVGVLLTEHVIDNEALAGVARTALTLGAAISAIPLAYLATHRGRRGALAVGWGLGAIGAGTLVLAGIFMNVALVVAGMLLFGVGTAAGMQTRFAATDLATPATRGRTLSLVVWFGTFGAVIGPNLGVPGELLAHAIGLPPLSGAFVIAGLLMVVASVLLLVLLRPDPLLTAEGYEAGRGAPDVRRARVTFGHVVRVIWRIPIARFALAAVVISHVSMVALMTMTPVHMEHNQATISFIGLTISVHVLGMFAFAPLVGLASDRFGPITVIVAGQVIFIASAAVALVVGEHSQMMMPTLFLLGLGWSCGTVPGSVLMTSSVPVDVRVPAQGVVDTLMNGIAATAAFLSGPIYVAIGFGGLSWGVAILSVLMIVLSLTLSRAAWRVRR